MADVASSAQVGKGTLYQYFRGKEDLFATLVETVARDSFEALSRRGVSRDPRADLRGTIDHLCEVVLGENLDLYRLFFDFWAACGQREEARRRVLEAGARFREFVVELVRAGQRTGAFRAEVDPEQFVNALHAAVDGLSLRLVMLGEAIDLRGYNACLQDLFVGGLTIDRVLRGASVMTERDE